MAKKKKRGRPPVYGPRAAVLVKLRPELLAALDKWRGKKVTRTAAIEKAIEEMLR